MDNPDLEQFSPIRGESCNVLAPEDYSCSPSKMIGDQALIIPEAHSSFMMKAVVIDEELDDSNQLFNFNDATGVPSELMVRENVEEHGDSGIILVPYSMIRQEDILEETEEYLCVSSSIVNEVVVNDHVNAHLDPDDFVIGSSIDIGSEQIEDTGFEEDKLFIDTSHYNVEDSPPENFYCDLCGDCFESRVLLKRHIKSNHSNFQKNKAKKSKSKEKEGTNKRYCCPSCSYSSERRDSLDKHVEKHVLFDGVHPSGKKRHRPEAFPLRQKHNAEEYKCPDCPYSCTVYKAFKKHQKMHIAGFEQYSIKLSCKICGKDRDTEYNMQKHMRKHQNNERFLCDLCNFSSIQLKKIIQHRRMHTGERPHLCPHCSYRSSRRDNLRSHVRRMHKRENMYIDTFNPNQEAALSETCDKQL